MTRVLRAIVVEDEPPIQNIIIKVLGRCGYIVQEMQARPRPALGLRQSVPPVKSAAELPLGREFVTRAFQPEDFEEEPE